MENRETKYLRAIARPKGRAVVELLKDGERSVSDISKLSGIPQPNISFQLKTLQEAGVVDYIQKEHRHMYFVKDPRVFDLLDTLKKIVERI